MVWGDVTLRAKFLVEPAEEGVLACPAVASGSPVLRAGEDKRWLKAYAELKRLSLHLVGTAEKGPSRSGGAVKAKIKKESNPSLVITQFSLFIS